MSDAMPDSRPERAAPAGPAKVDPETLVLRARPAPAIRFRRGPIIGLAGALLIGLAATIGFALKPRSLQLVPRTDDQSEPARPPTETLGALPGSYSEVPRLGPPLPGDLGRPILKHQRAMAQDELSTSGSAAGEAARIERERLATQARAARESGLLVRPVAQEPPAPALPEGGAPVPPSAERDRIAIDPERDPNGQQRKADFVAARGEGGTTNAHPVLPAASPYLLSAGSVIPASLITGIRSDLPGLVIAQVTEPVFDSPTGKLLLVPQGARLVGSYDSVIASGQRRALLVWQRIVFPDGGSLKLDNVPASDSAGYAGLEDRVDFHSWTLLKGIAMSTLLGVGANLSFSGESDLVRAIRESTQQNAARAGDQLTARNLQIQPTITVRPGAPVRLIVHRDLVLPPPSRNR